MHINHIISHIWSIHIIYVYVYVIEDSMIQYWYLELYHDTILSNIFYSFLCVLSLSLFDMMSAIKEPALGVQC